MDPVLEPLRDFDILHSRMLGEKPIQGTDGGDQPVTYIICFRCSRAHTPRPNWTHNWAVVKAVLGLVTLPTLITQFHFIFIHPIDQYIDIGYVKSQKQSI
jgi:hypothetical protein